LRAASLPYVLGFTLSVSCAPRHLFARDLPRLRRREAVCPGEVPLEIGERELALTARALEAGG
jgi:hypothetical protein